MEIQIHTTNVAGDEETLRAAVQDGLSRFAERITRVVVYLRDENAAKGGIDKRCVLEARPRGLDPVTAEHVAESVREATAGAIGKLERVLDRRFGRLADRH